MFTVLTWVLQPFAVVPPSTPQVFCQACPMFSELGEYDCQVTWARRISTEGYHPANASMRQLAVAANAMMGWDTGTEGHGDLP